MGKLKEDTKLKKLIFSFFFLFLFIYFLMEWKIVLMGKDYILFIKVSTMLNIVPGT